jgi:hypothetical protein
MAAMKIAYAKMDDTRLNSVSVIQYAIDSSAVIFGIIKQLLEIF